MPPTSDEELQELQENVASLRQQVVDANADREAYERSISNDIAAAELKAEAARLEAELARIDQATNQSLEGDSGPLVQATDLMENALKARDAAREAAEGSKEAPAPAQTPPPLPQSTPTTGSAPVTVSTTTPPSSTPPTSSGSEA
jgi:hypothetical protein